MKTKQEYISREVAVNAISKAAAEKWVETFWSPTPDQNSTFIFGVNVAVDAINSIPAETMTNGDMIRQMTDQELAEFFNCVQGDAYMVGIGDRKCCEYPKPGGFWIEWLGETAE